VAAGPDAEASGLEKAHVVSENNYGFLLIGFYNRETFARDPQSC